MQESASITPAMAWLFSSRIDLARYMRPPHSAYAGAPPSIFSFTEDSMVRLCDRRSAITSGKPPPMYSPSQSGIFSSESGLKNSVRAPQRRSSSKFAG